MREKFFKRRLKKTRHIIAISAFVSSRHQQNKHFEWAKLANDLTTNAARRDRLRYVPIQTSNYQCQFKLKMAALRMTRAADDARVHRESNERTGAFALHDG